MPVLPLKNQRSGLQHTVLKTMTSIRTVACGSLVILLFASAAQAEVFRYKEDGSITYGDRAPMSASGTGHSVLNNQGVVLEKVLSREERREQRRKDQEAERMRIRDRTLLDTFTTEEDLIRTRDDRVGLVDGLIGRLDDRIALQKSRLLTVTERILQQEQAKGAGNAQPELYEEQTRINDNIENTWSLIDAKSIERRETVTKFDDDLQRYRELKGER